MARRQRERLFQMGLFICLLMIMLDTNPKPTDSTPVVAKEVHLAHPLVNPYQLVPYALPTHSRGWLPLN